MQVAWLSYKDSLILSIGNFKISDDDNITPRKVNDSTFELLIKNVDQNYSGGYSCQVNTMHAITQVSL